MGPTCMATPAYRLEVGRSLALSAFSGSSAKAAVPSSSRSKFTCFACQPAPRSRLCEGEVVAAAAARA